ncbi:MAG: TonB-dependent receptor plug domain-containing protein [Gemmatimonadota bacterium]
MSRISAVSACVLAAALLVPAFPGHTEAHGQEGGSLFGTLFDQQTLQPLPGGTIIVDGSSIQAQSAADGSFTVTDLPAGPTTIRLTAAGYSTGVEQVVIGAGEVMFQQFALLPIGVTLGEVLVLAGRERPRSASSSVIAADDTGRARTAAEMLAQQVPGLNLNRTDGSVGGGSSIVIRGINSFTQSSAPAIYLDGVRIGASSPSANGSIGGFDVLDAIPASDVRLIRVLRGSSAEAKYPDSANGIIVIETHNRDHP